MNYYSYRDIGNLLPREAKLYTYLDIQKRMLWENYLEKDIKFDIFLSHSYADKELVEKVYSHGKIIS